MPPRQRRSATAATSGWTGPRRDESLNDMFSAMRDKAAEELQRDDISIGTEAERLLIGLPLPALCLRYLFQSTIWPLSRIAQLTGEEGCAKTALLCEIARWHMVHGGGWVHAENEGKDSPKLRHSILQWRENWLRRIEFVPTYSLEEWMDVFTQFIQIAQKQQDAATGPGRTVPLLFAVDSIMSTAPQSEIDAVLDCGHTVRGFALAAQLIAKYMRTMPQLIKKYPFSVVGTNHLKPATDYMGRPTAAIPGGKSVKFMETFEIEMHRAPSPDIDRLDYGGLRVRIVCRKNSNGPSRRQIAAELLWWFETVDGVQRQQTAWDWDNATIELLLSFELTKGKKTIYNRLQEICDIRVTNRAERLAWSQTLGIPQSDPVHYRTLGAILESRGELLEAIYNVLSITRHAVFTPGVDYRVALDNAREAGEVATRNLYENIEGLPEIGDILDPGVAILPSAPDGTPPEDDPADEEAI